MDPKDEQNDHAAYVAAFDEDMAPPREEEPVGGITPSNEDAPAQNDGNTGGEPAAVVLAVADGEQMERAEGAATADATTTSADEDDAPLDPKEEQRRRSWEGRLRAREAELERKEAELRAKAGQAEMPRAEAGEGDEPGESKQTEAMEQAADQLAASGNKEGAEAVEQVAEQVESGELTAAQAMKILADDFGEDFVKLIATIAGAQAKEAAGKIAQEATGQFGQTLESVIGNIADDRERAHFEAIADKHPDFNDVASTPEFAEFIKQYPDGERIADGGTAREIVKLLDKFKEAQKPAASEPDPALDAAQGVRSGGMRLPEAPVKAEGYESAWDQF